MTSLTSTSISTGLRSSVTMPSSGISVPYMVSLSVPLTNNCMTPRSMLQWLRQQHAGASGVSALNMRSSIDPFPWGPHWRRIWQQRRLLKASRAGEITVTSSSTPASGAAAPNSLLSIIRAEKSALSISQAPAASPTAEGPMCAGTVSRNTLLQNVILQAQSPLNLDSFQCYLACHSDR